MSEVVYMPCEECGSVNRVKVDRMDSGPRCARCKAGLSTAKPVEVSARNFDRVVLGSEVPVLVDFWATWCGPCRSMHPVLEELARRHSGEVLVAKLDTDRAPEVSARFGIRGVPTMIVFKNGSEVGRQVGAVPAAELEDLISRAAN